MTDERTQAQKQATKMPAWLFYGLVIKGLLVIAITLFVLYYAGVFG